MRFIHLYVLLVAFTSLTSFAQGVSNDHITLNGKIIDKADNSAVPFVHIINTSTAQGTASNSEGQFTIQIFATDTLLFSAIGFEKYIFTFAEGIDIQNINMTIALDASSMELEPVKIFAYKDEQSFKRAIISMEVPEEKSDRMQLEGLEFYYGPRKEVKPRLTKSPISYFYGKFSKQAKEKRRNTEVTNEHNQWGNNIRGKYTPRYIRELTKLPEDQIDAFIKFCKLNNTFLISSSEYEVVVAIQKCLGEYESQNAPYDTRDN